VNAAPPKDMISRLYLFAIHSLPVGAALPKLQKFEDALFWGRRV